MNTEIESILAAYPADRLRNRRACFHHIQTALQEGVSPNEMRLAIESYAAESVGFTRSKVCFSDNWFRSRRWQGRLDDVRTKVNLAAATKLDVDARLARWIITKHPLCCNITEKQAYNLVAAQVVTLEQVHAAGLEVSSCGTASQASDNSALLAQR